MAHRADSVDEKAVTVEARDVDEAFQFQINDEHATGASTDVNERRLMRKVDFMLMPLMFACYFLQYSDKTLINYAAVMGLIEDTNLPDNGFSHLAIAFYCSFLVFEPIQAYCIQRFPVAKWLGANGKSPCRTCFLELADRCKVICWGIVLTMNCVCHSFGPLLALRILLGVFESATAPRLVNPPCAFHD
jgi:hypothetical protein